MSSTGAAELKCSASEGDAESVEQFGAISPQQDNAQRNKRSFLV